MSRFGFSRLFELSTPFSLPSAGISCASSQEFIQQGRAAHSILRSRGSDRVSELHAAPKPKRQVNPTPGPSLVYRSHGNGNAGRLPDHGLLVPRFLAQEHHPTTHQQLTSHGDDRLLLAGLLPAGQPLIDRLRPRVVAQHQPGRFDQRAAQLTRAPFVDPALAIHLARLITSGDHSRVGRDLPRVLEAMGIVQVGHDDFRRLAADAGDRLQQLHALVSAR